jgi:hypothetical protein
VQDTTLTQQKENNASTETGAALAMAPNKKTLPPEAKGHFEASSSAFVAFAQKKDVGISQKTETKEEADLWDRALLFGEYPGGKTPLEILTPSGIPQRPSLPAQENIFPNQILTEAPKTPKEKEKTDEKGAPINIRPESIVLPRFIPKKPQSAPVQTAGDAKPEAKITLPRFSPQKPQGAPIQIGSVNISPAPLTAQVNGVVIPKKPVPSVQPTIAQLTPSSSERPAAAPQGQEMGELLQKKIIDGQLRSVFENAPADVRQSLEKMLARDILSEKDILADDQNPNNVWKKRLLEYIIKLKWQGKTVFKNAVDTDPREGETALAFIQRIYPSIIKVGMKEE